MSLLINTALATSQAPEIAPHPVSRPRIKQHDALDALAQTLMAGDLAAANRAFAEAQNAVAAKTVEDPGPSLAAIGTALKSGDLEAAKRALPRPATPEPAFSLEGIDDVSALAAFNAAPIRRKMPMEQNDQAVSGYASALSTAIKDGDPVAIKAAMANAMEFLTQSGGAAEPALRPADGSIPSAETPSDNPIASLLNDPNFNTLKTAVDSENPAEIKSAWAQFINGGPAPVKPTLLVENDPSSDLGMAENETQIPVPTVPASAMPVPATASPKTPLTPISRSSDETSSVSNAAPTVSATASSDLELLRRVIGSATPKSQALLNAASVREVKTMEAAATASPARRSASLLEELATSTAPRSPSFSKAQYPFSALPQDTTMASVLRSLTPTDEQVSSIVRNAPIAAQNAQQSSELQRSAKDTSSHTARTGQSGLTNRELDLAQERFRPNSLSMANDAGGESAFSNLGQSGSSPMSEERARSNDPGTKSRLVPAEFKNVLEALDVLLTPA